MATLFISLFVLAFYASIGYISRTIFYTWCWSIFSRDDELASAVATVAGTLWPLGWPAMIMVGLFLVGRLLLSSYAKGIVKIVRSFGLVFARCAARYNK